MIIPLKQIELPDPVGQALQRRGPVLERVEIAGDAKLRRPVEPGARIDPLRYGNASAAPAKGAELAFLRLRYKAPDGGASKLIEEPLPAQVAAAPSERLRFAAAVAAFAENLRGGKYVDGFGYDKVATLARGATGKDAGGYRAGMARLAALAGGMQTEPPVAGTFVR